MLKLPKLWIACSLFGALVFSACNENKAAKKNQQAAQTPSGENSTRVSDIEARSKAGNELAFGLDLPSDYVSEESSGASDAIAEEDAISDDSSASGPVAETKAGNNILFRCAAPGKGWFGYIDIRLDQVMSETTEAVPVPMPAEDSEGSVTEGLGLNALAEKPDSNWSTVAKSRSPINCQKGLQIMLRRLVDGNYRLTADVFGMKKRHAFSGETDVFEVKNGAVANGVVLRMKRIKPEPEGKVPVQVEWDDDKGSKGEAMKKACQSFYDSYKKDWKENEGLPPAKVKGLNGKCLSIIRVRGIDAANDKEISANFRVIQTTGSVPPQKWTDEKGDGLVRTFYLVPGVYSILGHAPGFYSNSLNHFVLRPGEAVDVKMKLKAREEPSKSVSDEVATAMQKCHAQTKAYDFATKDCKEGAVLIPQCNDANFWKFVQSNLKPALDKTVVDKFDGMWKDKVESVMQSGGFSKLAQCFLMKDPQRFGVNYTTPDGSSVKTVYVQVEKSPL